MIGLYAQDQYKATPKVTLNAGLRWDPNFPLTVVGGRGAVFAPGQQSTRFPGAPVGLVFPGDEGINANLMPTTYGYFEPRIGIAWQLNETTAVRAGFGLFTTPLEDAFYNHVWDTAPFSPSFNLNGTITTPFKGQ
jgi:outer membrane receptor protein involved in Fe transport